MADKKTRQLTPEELQEDIDSFAGLEGIPNYDPANSVYNLLIGTALREAMQGSETKEVQDYGTWQATRDKKVADQWAFRDYVRNARIQVKAQFGENSDEVQKVGLKKKSEYKSPTKKKKQTTT